MTDDDLLDSEDDFINIKTSTMGSDEGWWKKWKLKPINMKELENEVLRAKINQFKNGLWKEHFWILWKRKFVIKNPVLEEKIK